MGARVYDPYTGTFLQTDPIPGADANAYGYTDGDPVNETDLTGDATWAGALGEFGSAEAAEQPEDAACGPFALVCEAGGAILTGGAVVACVELCGSIGGGHVQGSDPQAPVDERYVGTSPVVYAKRPQPQTDDEKQQAQDLANEGNTILGSGHNPAKVPAWNDWWAGKTSREKSFYDWADGRRPARQ